MPAILSRRLRGLSQFFGIKDLELQYFLSQIVVPVVDAGESVPLTPTLATASLDLTGAGDVVAFTVPSGKEWKLRWLYRATVTTGYGGTYVSNGTTRLLLHHGGAGASSRFPINTGELPLLAGWVIGVESTGNAGDGAVVVSILYEEGDA